MKVRKLEMDVYNFVQKVKCATPPYLTFKFGKGKESICSTAIPSAFTSTGMSKELASALNTLLDNASILEVACGENFFGLLCRSRMGDLPVARYQEIHAGKQYQKYGYVGPRWLPVVYCSNKGIQFLLQRILEEDGTIDNLPSRYSEILTDADILLKGSREDRIRIALYTSYLLTEERPRQWDAVLKRVKVLPQTDEKLHFSDPEKERQRKDLTKMIFNEKIHFLLKKSEGRKCLN